MAPLSCDGAMLMTSPLIHLICGSTGAGKSTYALRLADEIGGVRFSIDEWMAALFWKDSPQPLEAAWSMERVERCYEMIWRVAASVSGRGVPAILDLGFSRRSDRMAFAGRAAEADLPVRLHFLDVPAEERWRRVQQRNAAQGGTRHLDFAITREMFDFVETMWEPPTPGEMAQLDGVRLT